MRLAVEVGRAEAQANSTHGREDDGGSDASGADAAILGVGIGGQHVVRKAEAEEEDWFRDSEAGALPASEENERRSEEEEEEKEEKEKEKPASGRTLRRRRLRKGASRPEDS